MKSLITGIDGFIGQHLTAALRARGDEVYGLSRAAAGKRHEATVYQADVTDAAAVSQTLTAIKPDLIWHLAAQSNIPDSFANPAETISSNILGSVTLFAAAQRCAPQATILSVGSSAEYGSSAAADLTEDTLLQPSSPYAIAKAAQGFFARLYAHVYGLRILHVRPFAIIGPGKVGDAVSDFCRAVVRIEAGGTPTLPTGNLDVIRDFMDVRDCAQAFQLIAERGVAGENYNVCNGVGASLHQILLELQPLAGTPFAVAQDPTRRRPVDDHRLVGDNAKLRALGYKRRYDLPATVRVTLDSWRVLKGQRQTIRP